jgi:hypothetical protein
MSHQTFIFECSSSTWVDCVDKQVFGSNKPWPLEVKAGDYCLLHHYEIGGLLGLWQATGNGGRNLVPKIWSGKFPWQVKVKLVIPKVTEVPKAAPNFMIGCGRCSFEATVTRRGINSNCGEFDTCRIPALPEGNKKRDNAFEATLGSPLGRVSSARTTIEGRKSGTSVISTRQLNGSMSISSDFRISRTRGNGLMPKDWEASLTEQIDDASVNQ